MNPLEQIFPKLGMGKGVPGLHPPDKVHYRGFRNVGLSPPKSSKYGIFVINLPLRGQSLQANFFYKIWHGEGVPGPHPHAKLHQCGFKKMWAYSPQNR